VDNLTHSLVGAALAELTLRDRATPTPRRLFLAAGVVASNFPDADLLYMGITPAPLGYLLHHRGHTHTLMGLLAQFALLALLCSLLPAIRRLAAADRTRLLGLIAISLAGHLAMDASNTYGVHPFYPFDSRWYYGDAVFIFEPWLWIVLGAAAAANARNRLNRAGLFALVLLLAIVLVGRDAISAVTLAALIAAALVLTRAGRSLSRRARSAGALSATALFIAVMFGLSRVAEARTLDLIGPARPGQILDIVLNPNPASPLCWAVIVVERDEHEYGLHRGTLSLLPAWQPPTSCASHRRAGRGENRWSGGNRLVWSEEVRKPVEDLRQLASRDCWVKAWLQFGRAPLVREEVIVDLRFQAGRSDNFTAMKLRPEPEAATCPANLTHWAMPRADLLESAYGVRP
jgi:inner membrane protein